MGRWLKRHSHFFPRDKRGFTLLEMTTSLAVLGVGLPAISMMLSVALQQDVQAGKENRARYLANALMSEISQRRFRESSTNKGNSIDTGEESGWVRTAFDDIDDYTVFTTWGSINPPRDEVGNVITGFDEYSQSVSVVNVPAPTALAQSRTLSTVTAGSTDFKLVTVTISWDAGRRQVVAEKVFALSLPEAKW